MTVAGLFRLEHVEKKWAHSVMVRTREEAEAMKPKLNDRWRIQRSDDHGLTWKEVD